MDVPQNEVDLVWRLALNFECGGGGGPADNRLGLIIKIQNMQVM